MSYAIPVYYLGQESEYLLIHVELTDAIGVIRKFISQKYKIPSKWLSITSNGCEPLDNDNDTIEMVGLNCESYLTIIFRPQVLEIMEEETTEII